MLDLYLYMNEHYVLATTMFTTGTLWLLGDTLAQKIEMGSAYSIAKHDLKRTGRLLIFALFIFSPLAVLWYKVCLDRLTGTTSGALLGVLLDQTIWAYAINSLLFFVNTKLEAKTNKEAYEKIQREIWPTMKVNWKVWPAVQLVNLTVVPNSYRILVVNIVSVPWTTYLALQAAKKGGDGGDEDGNGAGSGEYTQIASGHGGSDYDDMSFSAVLDMSNGFDDTEEEEEDEREEGLVRGKDTSLLADLDALDREFGLSLKS